MRLLVTGGGTGGHINPAIAIAQYFKAQDPETEILYAGTPNGMEADLAKKAGFDFAPIEVMGFSRDLHLEDLKHNVKAVGKLFGALPRSKEIIREYKPDLVIGTGGYVSFPVVLAAAKKKVKCAIHEQNAFPGITNRFLAKKVDKVFLAVEEAKEHLASGVSFEVVGNPVRESVMCKSREEARAELGLDDKLCILSFGGSLGADTINRIGADLMAWHAEKGEINHIHGYGRLGKKKFPALLAERGVELSKYPRIRALEFIDNMDTCLAAADLVICRAGAITISEIEATGKPSILVPSPNVTANHQFHNAMVLKEHGAAELIEEKDYDAKALTDLVERLTTHPEELQKLSENASSLAILDTTKRIYDSLMKK